MKTFRAALSSLLMAGAIVGSVAACSSAYADQKQVARARMTDPRIAIAAAPQKLRAPYDVQIIREDGSTLSTYAKGNRYYVLGNNGERYTVHITNPTARRIEAVITVDGLDVVDGENGDLQKRGYIIQPYGELRVEGFRTSTEEVATFRFSSVDGSYAGKKGKARNVGVVAVALFEEEAGQQLAVPVAPVPDYPYDGDKDRPYNWTDDIAPSVPSGPYGGAQGSIRSGEGRRPSTGKSAKAVAAAEPAAAADSGAMRPVMPSPPPPPRDRIERERYDEEDAVTTTTKAPPTNRPGLGTEFGESRYSPTQFTKFVRSSTRPIAIAELRYNDVGGLRALGIDIDPLPSAAEIDTRETADPFPGDAHFARPVR
ncbi:MAG TPA: hypothetical protein PLF40_02805 [Kofleriaceae bacterium]|nr:hypothetical protein [Kofleriaceae bacterium]